MDAPTRDLEAFMVVGGVVKGQLTINNEQCTIKTKINEKGFRRGVHLWRPEYVEDGRKWCKTCGDGCWGRVKGN